MNELNSTENTFRELLVQIQRTRQKVFAQANTSLMELYWHIGRTISERIRREAWGKGVVSELARYIAIHAPEAKGFSDKNLWRMKQFYETYEGHEQLSAMARVLPWTHNTTIFSRCKTPEERRFYLALCQQEKYSTRELERQIDAASFERASLSPQNSRQR
jgi:predicted nuclease of restriction endonuclease-like (RecB) superfamily